jgi:hypothetical protein
MFKFKKIWLMLSALLLAGCSNDPLIGMQRFYVRFSDYKEFSNYMGSAPLFKGNFYVSLPADLDKFDLLDFQLMFFESGPHYLKKPSFISPDYIHIKYKVDVADVESVTLEIYRTEKKDITGASQFKKTKEKIKDYPTFGAIDGFMWIEQPDYKIYSRTSDIEYNSPTDLKVRIEATTETLVEEIQIKDKLFADIKASLVTYRV